MFWYGVIFVFGTNDRQVIDAHIRRHLHSNGSLPLQNRLPPQPMLPILIKLREITNKSIEFGGLDMRSYEPGIVGIRKSNRSCLIRPQ